MAQPLNPDRVARVSFPIKFQRYASSLLLFAEFLGTSSVIKFTYWMYLFPMNKSPSCFPSRTIRIKLSTATAIIASGHFVLHKNSNTSLHLIALIVQPIESIPTKV